MVLDFVSFYTVMGFFYWPSFIRDGDFFSSGYCFGLMGVPVLVANLS